MSNRRQRTAIESLCLSPKAPFMLMRATAQEESVLVETGDITDDSVSEKPNTDGNGPATSRSNGDNKFAIDRAPAGICP